MTGDPSEHARAPRISTLRYRVPELEPLRGFYGDVLGMVATQGDLLSCGFPSSTTRLEFVPGAMAPAEPSRDDAYWKIGIVVRDLDRAVQHIREEGWNVSEPHLFRDIGYMSHMRDPAGLSIELLQQTFQSPSLAPTGEHPVGSQATIAHLTLRATDLPSVRSFCQEELGMQCMACMPVSDYAFSLYFYAWGAESVPASVGSGAMTSPAEREWLWSRPYPLLEIQHLETPGASLRWPGEGETAFLGLEALAEQRAPQAILAKDLEAAWTPKEAQTTK